MSELVTSDVVAYHEAGHCVVALATGCTVDIVTIGDGARVDYIYHCYRAQVMIACAGNIAQLRARPQSHRADDIDMQHAHDAAAHLGDDPHQIVSDLRPRTKDIVDRHWQQVEIIAAALLRYERLTGDQVNALLYRPRRRRVRARRGW